MSYYENRERARTINNKPTLTDQSAAKDTDFNVIINQFLTTGRAPGPAVPPIFGDFTNLPNDLRGFIETARTINDMHKELPDKLRALSVQNLMTLTNEQIVAIMNPPQPKPEDKKE